MIGERYCLHAQFTHGFGEILQLGQAIEQRKLRVGMKMNKICHFRYLTADEVDSKGKSWENDEYHVRPYISR